MDFMRQETPLHHELYVLWAEGTSVLSDKKSPNYVTFQSWLKNESEGVYSNRKSHLEAAYSHVLLLLNAPTKAAEG